MDKKTEIVRYDKQAKKKFLSPDEIEECRQLVYGDQDEAEDEEKAEAMRDSKADYMKLVFEGTKQSHMHLRESEQLKAVKTYEEFRTYRCNFVELKGVDLDNPSQVHEDHLLRNLKDHLGNVRFSYILYQAPVELVKNYNAQGFFKIEYDHLPDDVKECIPQKPNSVCMKFLLRNWQKDRFDLLRKPTHYPPSANGNAIRELKSKA